MKRKLNGETKIRIYWNISKDESNKLKYWLAQSVSNNDKTIRHCDIWSHSSS